jgi:hypothetical protein
MDDMFKENLEPIVVCGESVKSMEFAAKDYYPVIDTVIKSLTKSGFKIDLNFTHPDNINRTQIESTLLKVKKVLDIEENLWEPSLGVKGKIDATIDCSFSNKNLVIPLELKSGKGNSLIMQHRIQAQLYGMVQGRSSKIVYNLINKFMPR